MIFSLSLAFASPEPIEMRYRFENELRVAADVLGLTVGIESPKHVHVESELELGCAYSSRVRGASLACEIDRARLRSSTLSPVVESWIPEVSQALQTTKVRVDLDRKGRIRELDVLQEDQAPLAWHPLLELVVERSVAGLELVQAKDQALSRTSALVPPPGPFGAVAHIGVQQRHHLGGTSFDTVGNVRWLPSVPTLEGKTALDGMVRARASRDPSTGLPNAHAFSVRIGDDWFLQTSEVTLISDTCAASIDSHLPAALRCIR